MSELLTQRLFENAVTESLEEYFSRSKELEDKPLLAAADSGNLNKVKSIISTSPQMVKVNDKEGMTALHVAAQKDHLQIVVFLIENVPQLADIKDNKGWTALHTATWDGRVNIVKFLLEKVPRLANVKTNRGSACIHAACSRGHLDVFKVQLEKVPLLIEVKNDDGWTALHFAAINGSQEIVEFLVGKYPQLVDMKTRHGETAQTLTDSRLNRKISDFLKQKESKYPVEQSNSEAGGPTASKRQVKLFISYSWSIRKDSVQQLADYLKGKLGFQVWIDKSNLTDKPDIKDSMIKGIDYTFNTKKPIAPIRVEVGYVPMGKLLFNFGSNFRYDFLDDNFESAAANIRKTVASFAT